MSCKILSCLYSLQTGIEGVLHPRFEASNPSIFIRHTIIKIVYLLCTLMGGVEFASLRLIVPR